MKTRNAKLRKSLTRIFEYWAMSSVPLTELCAVIIENVRNSLPIYIREEPMFLGLVLKHNS